MAIKGGDLIHVGNEVLIDRIQTGGPGQVNIPTEKIYELGNYQSVGTILDTPDLSFSLDSYDVSAEFESILVGGDFASDAAGTMYDIGTSKPMDIQGQFKAGRDATNLYDTVGSCTVPYLMIESLSYRFGIRDNASQNASLRGDSIFYSPGSGYTETVAGSGSAGQTIVLSEPAYPYNGDGVTKYALGVCLDDGSRLRYGTDYTEAAVANGDAFDVTLTITNAVDVATNIRVSYASTTVASYPQNVHAVESATRPAAIRGRNIDVYVGGVTPADKWSEVQSVNLEWRVTLDRDEEFGSPYAINNDFDVPTVSGSIDIKPDSPESFMTKLKQITGVGDNEVIGALSRVSLPIDIVLKSPDDGSTIKTLHVPDVKFTLPGYSGRVQQKTTVSMSWESDGGVLQVYKGARP